MNIKTEKIILASSSPRRIEMMEKNGIRPILFSPSVDETLPQNIGMEQAVMYLALKKALSAEAGFEDFIDSSAVPDNPLIISADTVVYKDRIIGKPSDETDAFNILAHLRNEPHYVATGVCILRAKTPCRTVFCEVTKVCFKDYSDDDILSYIRTTEPYDKAGGYAIQGSWGKYVDHIDGDFDNVIGFPWHRITEELENFYGRGGKKHE